MQKFLEEKRRLENVVAELQAEKINLVSKRNTLENEYNDTLGDVNASQTEISRKKTALAKVEQSLADIDARIHAIQANIPKVLAELMPSVKEGHAREAQKTLLEYQEGVTEMRRLKAIILLHIRDMAKQAGRMRSLNATLNEAAKVANAPEYKMRNETPTPNLFSTYNGSDKPLAPLESEILEAFHSGRLPIWVKYFEETGEVLFSDSQARERLKKLRMKDENQGGDDDAEEEQG